MARYVEIHAPGKPAARHELTHPCVWVGSSLGGAIQKRSDSLTVRPELELTPDDQGVRVEALPEAAIRLSFHGAHATRVLVGWGDEIFLDEVRLTFVESKGSGRQRVLIAAVVGVCLLGLMAFFSEGGQANEKSAEEVSPPPLYAGSLTCSAPGVAAAEVRAVELERLASAKRERYAFDSRDGVAALPLFEEAAACLRGAGRIQDAQRVGAAFAAFRQKLDEDYAALRLELRSARSAKRYTEALRVTRELESLVGGHGSDAYGEWLSSVRRDLEGKVGVGKNLR